MSRQARILLLCDDRRGAPNTVLDHIDAFRRFSRHRVMTFNPKGMPRNRALDLGEFDVVAIHYSISLSFKQYVAEDLRDKLRRFRGLKIEFIQDDYRWVDRETAVSRYVGIDVLFTVAPEPAAGLLYDERLPGVRRVQTLAGYVPENLVGRSIRPLGERAVDVGYRARDLPFWFGSLSREKVWIGQRFAELASRYALRCDIAWQEQDRIYGRQWIEFLSSCRATLGCESGASIADFDGGAERAVLSYLHDHPAASYEEVAGAVLRPYEGNVVVHVISPRVFEAAALGTAMIMFPGEYSGVVRPGEHYFLLEKDFSNMEDVVRRLRDDSQVSATTSRAYDDLIKSGRWSYHTFVAEFDTVVDEEVGATRVRAPAVRYGLAGAERALRVPPLTVRLVRAAHAGAKSLLRRDRSMSFAIEYESQVQKGIFALRVALRERDLRPLLRLGRSAGAPLDRLLREILELSLLRQAASGTLPGQDFALSREFDSAAGALHFVSIPDGQARQRTDAAEPIRVALRSAELKAIDWDHRAVGGIVQLTRPPMEVGIGYQGLESFTVLAGIGRQNPKALERALAPVLRPDQATLPVG